MADISISAAQKQLVEAIAGTAKKENSRLREQVKELRALQRSKADYHMVKRGYEEGLERIKKLEKNIETLKRRVHERK